MVNKKAGRKGPVVLASGLPLRRRNKRGRGETFDASALAAPVPGALLVLLSRLHRREGASPEALAAGPLPPEDAEL